MDNQQLDITSEGARALELALELAWAGAPGGKATHYKVVKLREETAYYGVPETDRHITTLKEHPDGVQTLILLWSDEAKSTPLPFPIALDDAAAFVEGWLKTTEHGGQPDHDGDNGKGWRVFTEQWGHVAGHHYAIVGVQFAWAMYGK